MRPEALAGSAADPSGWGLGAAAQALAGLGSQALEWEALGYALALLGLAIVLLVLELFIVSFGVLTLAAIAAAGGAIYMAFVAGDAAGWALSLSVPLIAVVVLRWGLGRIQASRVVPKSEITAEAGYHHVADRIGVQVGSVGTMVTPAFPSGRARFDGGECDVQARGGTLQRDAKVVVKRIDGPVIFVDALAEEHSD